METKNECACGGNCNNETCSCKTKGSCDGNCSCKKSKQSDLKEFYIKYFKTYNKDCQWLLDNGRPRLAKMFHLLTNFIKILILLVPVAVLGASIRLLIDGMFLFSFIQFLVFLIFAYPIFKTIKKKDENKNK